MKTYSVVTLTDSINYGNANTVETIYDSLTASQLAGVVQEWTNTLNQYDDEHRVSIEVARGVTTLSGWGQFGPVALLIFEGEHKVPGRYKNHTYFVSEYSREGYYGGPEEGGWYDDIDTFNHIAGRFSTYSAALDYCRLLNKEVPSRKYLDGNMTIYTIETVPGSSEKGAHGYE